MNRATGIVTGSLVLGGIAYLIIQEETSGPDAKRARLLEAARADIGKTFELTVGDKSVHGAEVWRDLGMLSMAGKSWCGAWTLRILRALGLTTANWKIGLGYVGPLKLPLTANPKPGDIAYRDQPYQHYAFLKSLKPFVTIDGNSTGGVVAENTHASTDGWAFYSIDKLLG